MKHVNVSDLVLDKPIRRRGAIYRRYIKRGSDLVIALLLLPVLIPVIGVLWAMVRRDGGPGFYAQERVGLHGKTFTCWKMRTMVVDAEAALRQLCADNPEIAAEWHKDQKLRHDPRITRIGRFLRATSLDELPQIWNVLRGDMSLVGPRPFMSDQKALYTEAGGRAYFRMRPGITGAWQIDGRGATSFIARIGFDNTYFREMSLATDLRYMVKTVSVVLKRTGH